MGAGPILNAAPELQKLGYTISGVVVIDVVEGEPHRCPSGVMTDDARYSSGGTTTDEDYTLATTQYFQVGRGWDSLAVCTELYSARRQN